MTCPFCTNKDESLIESKRVVKFIEGAKVAVVIYDCQVCSKRWVEREKDE